MTGFLQHIVREDEEVRQIVRANPLRHIALIAVSVALLLQASTFFQSVKSVGKKNHVHKKKRLHNTQKTPHPKRSASDLHSQTAHGSLLHQKNSETSEKKLQPDVQKPVGLQSISLRKKE